MFPSQQVRVIVQECLHRCGNMAIPDRVADEYDVILVETFYESGDSRIVALVDSIQFRLCPVKHRVVVSS